MSDSGPLTQDQCLALLRRTCDENWLLGMLNSPDGHAIINSKLAVFEVASQAVMDQVAACSISTAPSGRPGICELNIVRPDSTATPVIPKGFKFVDSRGCEMLVALDVVLVANQTAILLPLQTVRQSDLVNNTEPAFDDMLTAGDAVAAIVADSNPQDDITVPPIGGVTYLGATSIGAFTYASSTPITRAEMDWLSLHGEERGCHRQPGEDGEAYRLRVRMLPDGVSPGGIQRAVQGAQAQGKLPDVYMVEPYRDQATDDARLALELVFSDSLFADDSFCDDGLGADLVSKAPFRTLETPGIREGRAYFRQAVAGNIAEPDGSGFYCDDGYCDDQAWGYPDAGLHPSVVAALYGIYEEARIKKAGGVQFDSYIENSTRVDGVGAVTADPTGTEAFGVAPTTGKAWMIREGIVTVSGPMDPATDAFLVALVLARGGMIVTPWISSTVGLALRTSELEKLGYYHDQVVGISVTVKSSVSAALRAVGTFWVTEMAL